MRQAICCTVLVGALVTAGCRDESPATARLPEHYVLFGRADSIARVLQPLTDLGNAPVAEWVREYLERTKGCSTVYAAAARPTNLLEDVRCDVPPMPAAQRWRGDADALLLLPPTTPGTSPSRVFLAPPHVTIEIAENQTGLLAWLRPGDEVARPSPLKQDGTAIAGWWRTTPSEAMVSSIAKLFSEKISLADSFSENMLATALDGHWGIAIDMTFEGEKQPRIVLAAAIGFSSEALARRFFDTALDQIDQRYELRSVLAEVPSGGRADCFETIDVLAEMKPCAVVRGRDVIVTLNQASLELLEGSRARDAQLLLNVERIRAIDKQLLGAVTDQGAPTPSAIHGLVATPQADTVLIKVVKGQGP